MSDDLDVLARLTAYHDHIAPPAVPVADDVRRGRRRVRRNRGIATGAVAAGVAGVVLTASVIIDGDRDTRPDPAIPSPSETTRDPEVPASASPGWAGAIREDQAALPVLSKSDGRVDGSDADIGWIDIRRLQTTTRPEWSLVLRTPPPVASTLDPARRVMEHGVVVDSDGDGLADCQIAISTDAPKAGDLRVWVTDLHNGSTLEQVGPPYGIPVDFFHPAEGEDPGLGETVTRTVSLFFLGRTTQSCELGAIGNFYAYAVVLDRGQDPVWDFAPDAAWLEME